MAVSSSRNSDIIQINSIIVNPLTEINDNIHIVSGTLLFNADVSSSLSIISVKIKDLPTGLEEDISSSLSVVAPNELKYTFDYSLSNTNIEILTPNEPNDTTNQHEIIVFLNNVQIFSESIQVDSCRKYFENVNIGTNFPAFSLDNYNFSESMEFNLKSYIVDSTDRLKMYCNGISSSNGIRQDFTVYNDTTAGSTPTILYDIASNTAGLSAYTYNLSSSSDIQIELEKEGFSQNNIFSIINAEPIQTLNVYMDSNFDTNPVTYSSSGETHIVNYRLFNPIWKDILLTEAIIPDIEITGQISGAIVSSISSFISSSNEGEITLTIGYKIDDAFVTSLGKSISLGTDNDFEGVVTISVEDFTMDTGTLTWSSVVTE